MTTFALVRFGVAHEIFRDLRSKDDLPPMHPDIVADIHPAPDTVAEGWPWDGAAFVAPPPAPAPPTDAERAARELANTPAFRALIRALADPAIDLSGMDEATAGAAIAAMLDGV